MNTTSFSSNDDARAVAEDALERARQAYERVDELKDALKIAEIHLKGYSAELELDLERDPNLSKTRALLTLVRLALQKINTALIDPGFSR